LFLKDELPEDRGEREIALTKASLRYASALAGGYADPAKLSEIYTVPRPKLDLASGLAKSLQDGKVADWFETLAPQTDEYRALASEFARYAKLNAQANKEAGERARQIAVNMERLRWLDRSPPRTRIDVNTAAA
jgi:murein L,D-transpeptidase YcbB/YkuD